MRAAGQFRHHAFRVHAAGQHVAVVAIAGDDLVARLQHRLHADHDRFLADIEVAEAADQPHAVHLPGLLLEAADEQHGAVGGELLLLAEVGDRLAVEDRLLGVGAFLVFLGAAMGDSWTTSGGERRGGLIRHPHLA